MFIKSYKVLMGFCLGIGTFAVHASQGDQLEPQNDIFDLSELITPQNRALLKKHFPQYSDERQAVAYAIMNGQIDERFDTLNESITNSLYYIISQLQNRRRPTTFLKTLNHSHQFLKNLGVVVKDGYNVFRVSQEIDYTVRRKSLLKTLSEHNIQSGHNVENQEQLLLRLQVDFVSTMIDSALMHNVMILNDFPTFYKNNQREQMKNSCTESMDLFENICALFDKSSLKLYSWLPHSLLETAIQKISTVMDQTMIPFLHTTMNQRKNPGYNEETFQKIQKAVHDLLAFNIAASVSVSEAREQILQSKRVRRRDISVEEASAGQLDNANAIQMEVIEEEEEEEEALPESFNETGNTENVNIADNQE